MSDPVSGWDKVELGEVCDILDKLRKPITKRNRTPGPYPYYGASGVLDYVDDYIFDEPLILIGEDGAKWGAGENSAFRVTGKVWVNNHAHVIRPHRNVVLDNWIIYHLNAEDLTEFTSGVTVPKLNQKSLRSIKIPLPPLSEQRRLVGLLDAAFAGLATATAHTQKNLQNARELFESHLNEVFSQSGSGWTERPLETLTDAASPITYGVVKPGPEGTIPFIRGGDIKDGNIDVENLRTITTAYSDQYRRTLLRGGELVVCLVGQPGQVGIVPIELAGANIARQVGLVRLDTEVNARFVCYFLRSPVGKDELGLYEGGSVQQVINLRDLKRVRVSLPDSATQQEIVSLCNDLEEHCQSLAASTEKKRTALEELKRTILHRAFRGELSAPGSDGSRATSKIMETAGA